MKITDEITRKLQEEIDRRGGTVSSIDELNKIAAEIMNRENNSPLADFEGLSPREMHYIISFPLSDECPVQLQKDLDPGLIAGLPMVRIAQMILSHIDPEKGLKMTASMGNLPRKVVQDIYKLDLFQNRDIKFIGKVLNEEDYMPAGLGKILLKMAGITRTVKNTTRMTRLGSKLMNDPVELFSLLFRTYMNFNKAWFDRHDSQEIGNTGFLFVVYLLSKYGGKMRDSGFYAAKYFNAYPGMPLNPVRIIGDRTWDPNEGCFTFRVFGRGLAVFGLVEIENVRENYSFITRVKAAPAFHKVFSVKNNG